MTAVLATASDEGANSRRAIGEGKQNKSSIQAHWMLWGLCVVPFASEGVLHRDLKASNVLGSRPNMHLLTRISTVTHWLVSSSSFCLGFVHCRSELLKSQMICTCHLCSCCSSWRSESELCDVCVKSSMRKVKMKWRNLQPIWWYFYTILVPIILVRTSYRELVFIRTPSFMMDEST